MHHPFKISAMTSDLFACARLWALCGLLLGPIAAQAQILHTTPDEFQAHLAAAEPGMVLLMAPGDYGLVSLRRIGGSTQAPLVLRSADPAQPAIISEMVLREVQNLTLDGILFDHSFELGDPRHFRPFQVLDSENIVIRNCRFDGDLAHGMSPTDDGFPTAFGLGVRETRGFTLETSEIEGFFRGFVISQSQDIVVHDNDLHGIRMDGMNFSEVRSVLIARNHIHDFVRSLESADHADMIQFWTNGTDSPSTDIVIRDNILNSGHGWYTQSIFMRNDLVDRGLAGDEMFYRNVRIEGNVILNAHLHGITVGETEGLSIRNNTVVRNATSEGERDNRALWIPQIRVAEESRNVVIANNVTSKISGQEAQSDWAVQSNFFVQDYSRIEPGFYGTVFSPEATVDPRNIRAFVPLPGGPLDDTGIGAPLLNNLP